MRIFYFKRKKKLMRILKQTIKNIQNTTTICIQVHLENQPASEKKKELIRSKKFLLF